MRIERGIHMVRVAIIDEKGNTVSPEDLTDTGLGDAIHGCKLLSGKCQELYYAMQEDEDEDVA